MKIEMIIEGETIADLIRSVDRFRTTLISYGVSRNSEPISNVHFKGEKVTVAGGKIGKGINAAMAGDTELGNREDFRAVIRSFQSNFKKA